MIANPPYVVSSDKAYNTYDTYDCHEFYSYFFEMAIKQLKQNGVLAFITASLYVKGVKFTSLRNLLEEEIDLIEYKYQGDDIFENVKMPTSTIIGKKGQGHWLFSELNPLTKLAAKLEHEKKRLHQISQIHRGLEIGRNEVLSYGAFPCITGTLVNKYLPHTIKYITQQTLSNNEKDERYFTSERILLRETGSQLLAVYLNEHLYSNRSLYSILITDGSYQTKYVLACLNSALLQFYYQVKFRTETELFPKIRIAQARLLPIPFATSTQQQPIITLVDAILSKKKQDPQADTSVEEREIDSLVYALYGLTEKEIAIVEGEKV